MRVKFLTYFKPEKIKVFFTFSFAITWYFLMKIIVDINCRFENTDSFFNCGVVTIETLILFYLWFLIPVLSLYILYSLSSMLPSLK